MTVIVETRADLTLETARRVAWDGEGVELGATALAAMATGPGPAGTHSRP